MAETRKYQKLIDLGVMLMVAGLYFLAAKVGLSLASVNASVSPVWASDRSGHRPGVVARVSGGAWRAAGRATRQLFIDDVAFITRREFLSQHSGGDHCGVPGSALRRIAQSVPTRCRRIEVCRVCRDSQHRRGRYDWQSHSVPQRISAVE